MADEKEIAILRERAAQARNLALAVTDQAAAAGLLRYAEEEEAKATELEGIPVLPSAAAIPSGEPPIAHAGAALKPDVPPGPEAEDPADK